MAEPTARVFLTLEELDNVAAASHGAWRAVALLLADLSTGGQITIAAVSGELVTLWPTTETPDGPIVLTGLGSRGTVLDCAVQ